MVTHSQDYSPNSNSTSIEEHRYCLKGLVTLFPVLPVNLVSNVEDPQGKGKRVVSIVT